MDINSVRMLNSWFDTAHKNINELKYWSVESFIVWHRHQDKEKTNKVLISSISILRIRESSFRRGMANFFQPIDQKYEFSGF